MITSEQILKSPEISKRYRDWRDNPDTRDFLLIVEREGKMEMPPVEHMKAEVFLARGGQSIGWQGAIARLQKLDSLPATYEELVATYGAEELIKVSQKNMIKKQEEKYE